MFTLQAFREKLASIVVDKHTPPLVKMGAILSQGIVDAGGRNVCLSLQSRSGFTKPSNVAGLLLFVQHW